jgi:endonuclease/exonuclease/phosphatase family metal-dependent hydrolase
VPYRWRAVAAPPAVMDWLLYKGVLITRHTLAGVPVAVLNTHLNANYSGDWSEANRYVRAEREQLRELAELVAAEPRDTLVVVLGDFNIPRGSWLYQEFMEASGLTDPLAGDTRSTYRVHSGIPERYALPIDFALVRPVDLPGFTTQSDLCFTERVPLIGGRQDFLSDHYAVELRIGWDSVESTGEAPAGHGLRSPVM